MTNQEAPQTPADTSAPEPVADAPQAPPATSVDAAAGAQPGEASGAEHGTDATGEEGPAGEHAEGGAEEHAEGDEHAEGGAEGHAGGGAEAAGPGGEKKRRRRRRRKKGGAQAGETAEAPAGEGAPEGAAVAASGEGAEQPAGAEGAPRRDKGDKHDRKKDKKAGPPRERPPVNAGDIVFGKIIEITDDVIVVDIPGKAKALFDRREMLLSDDEEEKGRPAPAAAASADVPAEGQAASAAAPAPEGEGEPVAEAVPAGVVVAEAEAAPAPPAPEPAAAAELPEAQEPGEQAAPPAAEPTREPKVPRVVLEVGADFIAVVHNDGARGGLVVLTHHPRRVERAKPLIEKAFNDKTLIEGLVTGVIKGGIEVDIDGLRAFAPGSHVDLRLGADLSHLVAKRLPFLVTQYAKRGRDVVLSRKPMLEEEGKKARALALERLTVGSDVDGIVRSVVSFGAFVDVGGVEGLVPLQEMSHNRSDAPGDVFKAGQPTRVRVTKIDERGKIWLSHRATIADPWGEVARKYAQGTKHTGKVVRIQPFGAFVELEPGVDGLIHLPDLSLKRIESPEEVVKVGDPIDVVVSHVEAGTRRIGLHPALAGDAANEAPQRIAPHKSVKAKILMIESGGLVVRILGVTGRSARGYVTAAGTGTARGTELRKAFNIGQELEGKVIEIDPRRGEVKLSIKALSEDQERSAYQQYRQQLKAEARFTFGDLLAKKGPSQR